MLDRQEGLVVVSAATLQRLRFRSNTETLSFNTPEPCMRCESLFNGDMDRQARYDQGTRLGGDAAHSAAPQRETPTRPVVDFPDLPEGTKQDAHQGVYQLQNNGPIGLSRDGFRMQGPLGVAPEPDGTPVLQVYDLGSGETARQQQSERRDTSPIPGPSSFSQIGLDLSAHCMVCHNDMRLRLTVRAKRPLEATPSGLGSSASHRGFRLRCSERTSIC